MTEVTVEKDGRGNSQQRIRLGDRDLHSGRTDGHAHARTGRSHVHIDSSGLLGVRLELLDRRLVDLLGQRAADDPRQPLAHAAVAELQAALGAVEGFFQREFHVMVHILAAGRLRRTGIAAEAETAG